MDGPRDCHTEGSQTEKEKYHRTSLICRIYKGNGANKRIYITEGDSQTENKFMVAGGKG